MTFSDRKWRLSSGTTRSYRKTAFLSEDCCGIHWKKKIMAAAVCLPASTPSSCQSSSLTDSLKYQTRQDNFLLQTR